jgi:hypothetical protein
LTLADRAVHAALVSLHRLGRLGQVTQEQIAAWACVGRRTVVRSVQRLASAGLLLVRRLGQGRPNGYELIGMDPDALAGRSARDARPHVPSVQTAPRRDARPKSSGKDISRTGIPGSAFLPREPGFAVVDGRLRYVGPG